jgi:nitroreductase
MDMDFNQLIAERYSVRAFDSRPVESEIIEHLLEAARLAPTAHNNQPQRLLVISQPDELIELRACTNSHFDAPLAILVSYDKNKAWVRSFDGKDSGFVDGAIVGTQLMLAAAALGLGSCWVMAFNPDEVIKRFHLPENLVPVALFPLGYPAKNAKPAPAHKKRNSLDKFVQWERY